MRRQIKYEDAVRVLGGGDSRVLDAVDGLLGVVIVAAAAGTGRPELLAFLHGRDELVKQTQRLLSRISQRVRGTQGKSRTELLVAAHAIVAINAYFEVLSEVNPQIVLEKLVQTASSDKPTKKRIKLAPSDELIIMGVPQSSQSRKLVEAVLDMPLPIPAAHRAYESVVADMRLKYREMSKNLIDFVEALALWGDLTGRQRIELNTMLLEELPSSAAVRYDEDFRRLATDCPEFQMWMYLTDSAATRSVIETGLVGLQETLDSLVASRKSSEWPSRLARAYRPELRKPIIDTSPGEVYAGLGIPPLVDAYVGPWFRPTEYDSDARPAEESWWTNIPLCTDIAKFIAGHLTSPTATEVPLVILGHPGSGKSLFTKMLAARLPAEEYLPIRVELRRVAADKRIKDQIEAALSDVTNEIMEWSDLARAAGDTLPVVLLDGFDEILQATKVSRSDYLLQVQEFQRREAEQGRRLAVVVTSRIIVADRIQFPEGTVLVRLEPFADEQISRWLEVWNGVNEAYFQQHKLQRLLPESVLLHRDLASQPLLLLMLALYDADGNALQHDSGKLARSELYERLVAKFVRREVDKLYTRWDERARHDQTEKELQQLSILAFGMFSRGRKTLSEGNLNNDLLAFMPQDEVDQVSGNQLDHRLSQGELVVGRFFFVHTSQSLVADSYLREYEFLHATFGEYLVARIISLALNRPNKFKSKGSAIQEPSPEALDDQLWGLLSFEPLTDGSQTIGFLDELIRQLDDGFLLKVRGMLGSLLLNSLKPRLTGYQGYQLRELDVPRRHAIYSINLLILNLLCAQDAVHVSKLFTSEQSPIDKWQSFALLWRSQIETSAWGNLVNALVVSRVTTDKVADLEIRLAVTGNTRQRSRVDAVPWLRSRNVVLPSDLEFMTRQSSFLCMPEMDLLMHAVDPLVRYDTHALGALLTGADGTVRSVINEAIRQNYTSLTEKIDGVRQREGHTQN